MSLSAPASAPPVDDIYKKMTVAATVFAVIFEAGYLLTSAPPYDGLGYLIGRDFVNTWMGANSALRRRTGGVVRFRHLQRGAGGAVLSGLSRTTTGPIRRISC